MVQSSRLKRDWIKAAYPSALWRTSLKLYETCTSCTFVKITLTGKPNNIAADVSKLGLTTVEATREAPNRQQWRTYTRYGGPQRHHEHTTLLLVVTAHYILKCSVVWLSCRYGVVCLVFGRRLALVGHHNKVDRACNFGVAMTLKKRRLKLTLWVQTIKDTCMQRDINIEVDIACRYCHLRQVWRLAQSSTCCNTSKAVNTRFWSRRQLPRRDSTCRSATMSFAICTLLTTLLAFSLAVRHCHGIFTARRYSSAVLRCLYLSVCLSQVGIVSKREDDSSWYSACRLPSAYPSLCCKKTSVPPKVRILFFETLFQTIGLENFATPRRSYIATCCQHSSTKADTRFDNGSSSVEVVDNTCDVRQPVYYTKPPENQSFWVPGKYGGRPGWRIGFCNSSRLPLH